MSQRPQALVAFAKAVTILIAAFASLSAWGQSYQVTVDTSSLAGSNGYLNFQFNPADLTAPSAVADIAALMGSLSLLSPPSTEGGVVGALPGSVSIFNSGAFNDYFQSVQFGTSFSFLLSFSGDFQTQPSLLGTSFALSLYAGDASTPLLTNDVSGSLVRFELAQSGVTFDTFPASVGGLSAAQVAPVPLPAASWFLLSGILGLMRFARRRVSGDALVA